PTAIRRRASCRDTRAWTPPHPSRARPASSCSRRCGAPESGTVIGTAPAKVWTWSAQASKVRRVGEFYRVNVRVHWADTDAAGIVWVGNFLRFFGEGGGEVFRALGRP